MSLWKLTSGVAPARSAAADRVSKAGRIIRNLPNPDFPFCLARFAHSILQPRSGRSEIQSVISARSSGLCQRIENRKYSDLAGQRLAATTKEILECVPRTKLRARFIEPMLLLRTDKLPEGPGWLRELKFDGYRALAIKTGGRLQLRSRNDKDFGARYPAILKALAPMPDETVIDGEVVALDPEGRPSFNLLQNYGSARAPLHFFVFDILILGGEDVMSEPLVKRRQLLENHVLPKLAEPIRYSPILEGSLKDLIHSIKASGFFEWDGLRRARYATLYSS